MYKLIRLVSRGDEVIGLDGISSAHASNGRKGQREKTTTKFRYTKIVDILRVNYL